MVTRRRLGFAAGALVSFTLIVGALLHSLPLDITEVLGFVSGACGVWLTVEENIWNWPIGIANSAFFLLLFVRAHLFADSGLQVVYIVLGALGWYWWLRGGVGQTELPVGRTGARMAVILAATLVAATAAMTVGLARIGDATPFLDALTTTLSLLAQYMLTRKLIENWLLWMAADVIYVGLYTSRSLYLTAVLYAVFLAMCGAGWAQWRATLAPRHVDRLTVIVCDAAGQVIPGPLRASWLRELHPGVEVMCVEDTYPPDDSRLWAALTVRWLGYVPDAVFTSEDYGDAYARLMGSVHVLVDRARQMVPCSGTNIRADPLAWWDYLSLPVRAYYCRRICVVGAESSGTTTLTAALAAHYHTTWAPEYGRTYWEERAQRLGAGPWRSEEFVHIAREQCRSEDEAARAANRLLLLDTDAFATTIWHERYVGSRSAAVEAVAASHCPHLYILTGVDIPFVQDGTRDGEHVRTWMHGQFLEELPGRACPYVVVAGTHDERMRAAIAAIDEIVALATPPYRYPASR